MRWEEEEATRKWEQFLLPNHTCLQGDERGDYNGVFQLNIIIVKCAHDNMYPWQSVAIQSGFGSCRLIHLHNNMHLLHVKTQKSM